jgi:hypothetical protein
MRWKEAWGVGGLFLVVSLAYVGVRAVELPMLRAPDGQYVLADPDSFMRWRLVTRAIDGEGVRIHWMNEDNAPQGRMNEWTSPMTILGVTVVRLAETFGGMSREAALEWVGMWLGPVVGLLSLAALGWFGWRAGGWALAACWMVAWPALEDVILFNRFGNTDHHSLHQLLFICMVGGCFAWARKPTGAGGVFVGIASAAAMWSAGTEMLPAWLAVAGLAAYEAERSAFWRGWWIAGLAGTTAAWLFEFWPHVFHGRLEFISVWHVVLWLAGGAALEWRVRTKRWWPVAVAGALMVLAAGAVRGFDWSHLHVMQDERLQRQIAITQEYESIAKRGMDYFLHLAWTKYGLLPLLLLVFADKAAALDRRTRWLGVVAGIFFLLTLYQSRWVDFFVAVLVMIAGVSIRSFWPNRTWASVCVILVATLPSWFLNAQVAKSVKLVGGNSMRGPHVETFALRAASECLSGATKPVVLAAWDEGAILAGMGNVRVVGSQYWSNLDGLMSTHELFTTTSPERFWELVRQRGIEFLIVPASDRLERAVLESFVAFHGRAPAHNEVLGAVIWQITNSDRYPVLPCPELTRLNPQWKIVRLVDPAQGGASR